LVTVPGDGDCFFWAAALGLACAHSQIFKTVEAAAEYVAEQCASLREELYNLLQDTLERVPNPVPPDLALTPRDLEAAISFTYQNDDLTIASLRRKGEWVPSYYPHLLALRFLQDPSDGIGVAVQHLPGGEWETERPPASREEWINLGYTGQVPPCVSLLQWPSHYDLWVQKEDHGWAENVMDFA
jgi:hypothetical protein